MMDHRYLMTMVKKRHLAGIFVFTSSTNHASVRAEMIFFFSFGRFLVIFDTFLVLFLSEVSTCPKGNHEASWRICYHGGLSLTPAI